MKSIFPCVIPLTCLLTVVALIGTGCLSSTYSIPESELERLASMDADKRADNVRIYQRSSWAADPPEAGEHEEEVYWEEDHEEGSDVCHHSHVHVHSHGYIRVVRVRTGPRYVYRTPRGRGYRPAGRPGGRPPVAGKGRVRPRGKPTAGRGGRSGARPTTKGGGGKSGSKFNVGGQKYLAVAVVAVAGAATVGLVATQGVRYDGWASVSDDHPIHLRHSDGRYSMVPLSALAPEDLDDIEEAVLVAGEGDLTFRKRAPLSRTGLAWKFELGMSELRLPEETTPFLPSAYMGLGVFPIQELGLFAFATLTGGKHEGGDIFGTRYGLEIEALPFHIGRVHLGAYGWGGFAYDVSEGGDLPTLASQYYGVGTGALVEYDVTTHFAISLRSGLNWQHRDSAWTDPAFMTTIGVAVY